MEHSLWYDENSPIFSRPISNQPKMHISDLLLPGSVDHEIQITNILGISLFMCSDKFI